MEKSQVKRAVVGLVVTLFVLFGGYFAFQEWSVRQPIRQAVLEAGAATVTHLEISPERVNLRLKVKPGFVLSPRCREMIERIESAAGARRLSVDVITGTESPELLAAWDRVAFAVKEGIAKREYTKIPEALSDLQKETGITASARMDERFVYLELGKGDRFLVRIVPLNKAESEVNTID
ncbi:hypothetical protein [Staphylospora marina]|uniref:hypothetical protein n=1 Tax=Staphylospora marina TaxID=2490858 RepID=UPI000F5C1028|nr:hypothetical protein [Staphylospora marina]